MTLPSELIAAAKNKQLILFVGAGVSMTLGLPSWSQLIDKVATELNYDPSLLRSYGDSLAIAEFYKLSKGNIGELRSWMDQNWHQNVNISKSRVHKAIVEIDFPLIYTTNYDHWLERSFTHWKKDFTKIVSVGDFPKITPNRSQIVKFHGDVTSDESIVLDETSYFERMSFESPLDIKLRADSIGNGILFIGYSLTDMNMRYLLYKLSQIWKGVPGVTRPSSYLFSARPNPVKAKILKNWGVEMLSSDEDDPKKALQHFLEALKST